MSPVRAVFTSSLELACISSRRPILSFFPLLAFSTYVPAFSTPLYTRTNVRDPTKESVMILKARPEKGSSSDGLRMTTASGSSASVPWREERTRGEMRGGREERSVRQVKLDKVTIYHPLPLQPAEEGVTRHKLAISVRMRGGRGKKGWSCGMVDGFHIESTNTSVEQTGSSDMHVQTTRTQAPSFMAGESGGQQQRASTLSLPVLAPGSLGGPAHCSGSSWLAYDHP